MFAALTSQQQIAGVVGIIILLITLWALLDAVRRPSRAFEAAGVSKTIWVVLLLISLFVPCGIVLAAWWLISTGPRVHRQQQIGGIGFPGGRR